MRPAFDEHDAAILAQRVALRDDVAGPRIGDFVEFSDGRTGRFSHDWGDALQWSVGGSFHLTEGGFGSYSGSLEPSIPTAQLVDTGEQRDGRFWIFHHNRWAAHNGVDVPAPCRVYRAD